jgi:tellurium resistance protein TerZ
MNTEEFDIKGNSIRIGINWGSIPVENSYFYRKNHQPIDLNLSCVMIGTKGKIEGTITPSNPETHFQSIKHSGDDKVGDKGGDDNLDNESLIIKLSKIEQEVSKLYVFLSAKEIDYKVLPHALFSVYDSEVEQKERTVSAADLKVEDQTRFADNILMCTIYKTNLGWKYKKNINAFPKINEVK